MNCLNCQISFLQETWSLHTMKWIPAVLKQPTSADRRTQECHVELLRKISNISDARLSFEGNYFLNPYVHCFLIINQCGHCSTPTTSILPLFYPICFSILFLKKFKNQIKIHTSENVNVSYYYNKWSWVLISPGENFMEKLSLSFRKKISVLIKKWGRVVSDKAPSNRFHPLPQPSPTSLTHTFLKVQW